MGDYPYMHPFSLKFIPSNSKANIAYCPAFTPVETCYLTGVSVIGSGATTGDDTDYVDLQLVQLANASNVVATINFNTGVNGTANAATQLAINSSLNPVSAGTVLGWLATFGTVGNQNLGAMALYQIDYIQGSPAAEG
jgi:hypothetical protein